MIIPEKLSDYEGLLNSRTLTCTFPLHIIDFTDDYLGVFDVINNAPAANGYFWKPIITVDEKSDPDIWGPLYNRIYSTNVIINGVMKVQDGAEVEKKKVMGEALVMRANLYMDLLTVFAKAYNPSTAATDPGMPMPTNTDITGKAPARLSVQATLEAMTSDVKNAIEMLPLININRYRVTKFSAYGLLSRIYLYRADFENAKKYTDLALEAPHRLLDYNEYNSYTEVPVYDFNPEILWQRMELDALDPIDRLYTEDLKNYFSIDDIRLKLLTTVSNYGVIRAGFKGFYNFGITFPEMYLTKAELLAREGKFNEAMDVLNLLRKHRIKKDTYKDQSASSAEDALIKVLAERRRELAFSGTRWFDMKRLDKEGRMPEVKRLNKETQAVEASLPPHSPKYTFEIPIRVQKFNPGMVLNHR